MKTRLADRLRRCARTEAAKGNLWFGGWLERLADWLDR
jgi:hypothetical protein